MNKINYNKKNLVTEYIVKKFQERFPDGTLHSLARDLKRNKGTLYNTFKADNAWQQAVLLFEISAYLGIPIEEALLQDEFKYDSKEEIEQWKKMYFEEKNNNEKLIRINSQLKAKIDKINKIAK